jgi:hypothetical protein
MEKTSTPDGGWKDIIGRDSDHQTSGAANTIFIHKVQWSFMPVWSAPADRFRPQLA